MSELYCNCEKILCTEIASLCLQLHLYRTSCISMSTTGCGNAMHCRLIIGTHATYCWYAMLYPSPYRVQS